MNLAQSETTAGDMGTSMNLQSDTRLHGHLLLTARVTWVVLALTMVVLNVLALPGVPASLFTPEVTRELRRLNFSPALYLALNIGMTGMFMLVYLAISGLLFWLRSADRMALFCSLTLLTFGGAVLGFFSGAPPAGLAWNIAVSSLFFLGQVSFIFFYLFPSGRFVPRWTRWCALLWIVYQLVLVFFFSAPFSGPPVLLPFFLLTAVIAQIYRYRSASTLRERQQTKWVVFGFVFAIMFFLLTRWIYFLLPSALQRSQVGADLLGGGSIYLAFMLIPICIGIAILRSQLFDIDLIIKRTLVYGTLTACVIGMYILVVGYLGALFHTNGNLLISLITTGLVAVFFQPLRALLQRGVNRLLYGLRDEPYVVLAGLGQRLQTTLAPDTVLATIVETVQNALKLSYAAIEVKEGTAFVLAASAGNVPEKEVLRLPLVYQREPVGTLIIAPRGRDETLAPADLRLLDDLADQIGIAVHTVSLTNDLQAMTRDLQHSREHLVTTREEERRRLRRDLHDGLGPALASITLKLDAARNLLARDPSAADALLVDLKKQTQGTVADIRRLVYELRPPSLDELGLIQALREQAEQYLHDGLRITLDAPEPLPPLPAAVEVATYRIVQEAMTNVVRHAQAHICTIRFALDHDVDVEICDDGQGISAGQRAGVGLISIRERVAELGGICEIEAMPAGGTRLHVRLPLPKAIGREE